MTSYAAPSGPPPPQGLPGGPPGPQLNVSQTKPIPFTRLVIAEARKSVNTLAGFWLIAGIGILLTIVLGFLTLIVVIQESIVAFDDFRFFASGICLVALPILAIMLVTGEWTQRTAMVSFALEPRRLRILLAKYVVGVGLTLAAVVLSLVVAMVCTGICELFQPELTEWNLEASLIGGFFITQVLAMSLGFALACLLLNTPAAIVLFVVYRALPLLVFGIIAGLVPGFEDVLPWINFELAQVPLYDLSLDSWEELAHLLVAGSIWLALPLGLGLWRILRAEVK